MRFPTEAALSDLSLDKFGHKALATALVNNVFLEMGLPNTFGVYGNWGTGKSTFLHALHQEILNNVNAKDILTIRFEPWKYEYAQSVDLFISLISEFREQANVAVKSTAWQDLTSVMLGMSSSIFKQLIKKTTLEVVDIDDMRAETESAATQFPQDQFQQVDSIQQLRAKLATLIQEALRVQEKKRVCIFIDDLDRCSPEHTTTLLEAIKNFLLTDRVLFVFALDRRIVAEMIEQKYGLGSGYGDEYLTKIIQYSLTLPTPSHKEVLADILDDHLLVMPERTRGWIVEFTDKFAPETRKFKHLVYQLLTQAKLANIDLTSDDETDTAGLFCAIYLKFRFPRLFHVNRKTALDNLRLFGKMVSAQADKQQGNAEDMANQLSISGSDKKVLMELYVHKLPNGKDLMNENRGKLQEMGFGRMVD